MYLASRGANEKIPGIRLGKAHLPYPPNNHATQMCAEKMLPMEDNSS